MKRQTPTKHLGHGILAHMPVDALLVAQLHRASVVMYLVLERTENQSGTISFQFR